MPPQGNLGRGEACVVRKSVEGALLPLPSVRGSGYDVVVKRDGQVARKKLSLCADAVETW